jgi:hypothetical protein
MAVEALSKIFQVFEVTTSTTATSQTRMKEIESKMKEIEGWILPLQRYHFYSSIEIYFYILFFHLPFFSSFSFLFFFSSVLFFFFLFSFFLFFFFLFFPLMHSVVCDLTCRICPQAHVLPWCAASDEDLLTAILDRATEGERETKAFYSQAIFAQFIAGRFFKRDRDDRRNVGMTLL